MSQDPCYSIANESSTGASPKSRHHDVTWREYDIHETSNPAVVPLPEFNAKDRSDDDNENESDDAAAGATAFWFPNNRNGDGDGLEEMEVRVGTSKNGPTLVFQLRCQDDYDQSTGMAIWRGSEVLAEYLLHHPGVVRDQRVLELGAGVGLVGLVAHHLDATEVIWTDGDQTVLQNLRRNVRRNRKKVVDETSTTTATTTASSSSSSSSLCGSREHAPIQVVCPQLIWGRQVEDFQRRYGPIDVVLGTDLFYMTKSLKPLFATIDQLVTTDGTFVTVNTCASQSSMSTVLDIASQYGWTCLQSWVPKKQQGDDDDDDNDDDDIVTSYEEVEVGYERDDYRYQDEQVYIFGRTKKQSNE